MSGSLLWYVARAGGLVAWGLTAATVIWGLALSTRVGGAPRGYRSAARGRQEQGRGLRLAPPGPSRRWPPPPGCSTCTASSAASR